MSSSPFHRRHFLASMAGGVAGLATACSAPLRQAGAETVAGASVLPRRGTGQWDDSWTRRLGQHRTVFDVPDLESEPGVYAVAAVMDAYHDVLGTTDGDLGFVLVLRHRAVPLFFSDAIWAKYDVARPMKEKDPATNAPYRVNPMWKTVAALQARGVTVLGCNRAVSGFITRTAEQAKTPEAEVRREVMDAVMPGVILLPNGLFALARAQEVGCGFMR